MWKGFYNRQPETNRVKYLKHLYGTAQQSRLYSENQKPYIVSRTAEKLFCKCFDAIDLGRKDCSVDAMKEKDGIGIKTFIRGSSTSVNKYEKIAEFNNKKKYKLSESDPLKIVKQIAYYRNERLNFTSKEYDIKNMLYHCLVRDKGKIFICEYPMLNINEAKIVLEPSVRSYIYKFRDENFQYHFHSTKNTLYKKFDTSNIVTELDIPSSIDYDAMMDTLKFLIEGKEKEADKKYLGNKEYVILPLYSVKEEEVPLKSGLNQWNAAGRSRHPDELYIPIPRKVHKSSPGFFPPRDHKFKLITDNQKEFPASVCQDGSKALMSDPNKDLGNWLLREKLKLKPGEIATMQHLRNNNADTVIVYKLDTDLYQISLHSFGAFEKEYTI